MNPAGLFLIAFAIIGVVMSIGGSALTYAHQVESARRASMTARAESLSQDWLRAAWSPYLSAQNNNLPVPSDSAPIALCGTVDGPNAPCNSYLVMHYGATQGSSVSGSSSGVVNPQMQTDPRVGEAYRDVTVSLTLQDANGHSTGARRDMQLKVRTYFVAPYVTIDGEVDSGEAANVAQAKASGCNGLSCGEDTRIHAYLKCVPTQYVLCGQAFNEVGGFTDQPYSSSAATAPTVAR